MSMDQSAHFVEIFGLQSEAKVETSVHEETQLFIKVFIKERHQWVLPSSSSSRIKEEDEPIVVGEFDGPQIEKNLEMAFFYLWLPRIRDMFVSRMLSSIDFLQPQIHQFIVKDISEFASEFADAILANRPKMIAVVATIEVFTKEEYVMPWIDDALKVKILEINDADAGEICSICLKKFTSSGSENQVAEMPCAHIFHKPCITRWLVKKNSCPLCRFEM